MPRTLEQPRMPGMAVEHVSRVLERIRLADIDVDLDQTNITATDLAPSIRAVGLINPVSLSVGIGCYHIIAGRRRIMALKQIAAEDQRPERDVLVDAYVYDDSLTQAQRASITLRENANRSENVVAELEAIEQLMTSGMEEADIARHLRVDKSWVERRLRIRTLPDVMRRALASQHITMTTALAMSRLPPHTVRHIAASYAREPRRITGREIAAESHAGPVDTSALFADLAPPVSSPMSVRSRLVALLDTAGIIRDEIRGSGDLSIRMARVVRELSEAVEIADRESNADA